MTLMEILPSLVVDIEGALIRIGRGDVADQLRDAPVRDWRYDELANSVYLHVSPVAHTSIHAGFGGPQEGQTVSLFDELGVDVHLDRQRQLRGLEILDAAELASRLKVECPR
jgi:hypothetical protein